jgi:tetratricopeptide (TPR) repeat protein
MRRRATCPSFPIRRGACRPLLIGIALLCGLTLLAGCADFQKKPSHKKLPAREYKAPKAPAGGVTAPTQEAPKSVIRPAAPATAPATPARQASDRLVAKGQALLDAKDYERAASAFREAANVDAQNGAAYYYLALAQARLGQPDVAAGLLDKAEALLNGDPEWTARIDELRAEVGGAPPKPLVSSPIDKSF